MSFNSDYHMLDFSLAYEFAVSTLWAINEPGDFGDAEILSEFLGVGDGYFYEQISKPKKNTLLHTFIANVNSSLMDYETGHQEADYLVSKYLPVLTSLEFDIPNWFNDSMLGDHIHDLDEMLEDLILQVTDATFHILFADKGFMYKFSIFVSDYIKHLKACESSVLVGDGVVRRSSYLPIWLKTALFHRDKGRCQECFKDVTYLINQMNRLHYDHLIPLSKSGTNDPTNFQILCDDCNLKKSSKIHPVNRMQPVWW